MPQVQPALAHNLLVDGLTMLACPTLPLADGALVETKGLDDSHGADIRKPAK